LRSDPRFDPAAEQSVKLAIVLDQISAGLTIVAASNRQSVPPRIRFDWIEPRPDFTTQPPDGVRPLNPTVC
jgi:hypothetical protein